MNVLRRMLSRRWILATLLVIAAMGVMIRLGIWQLDRLEQRRLFNARVLAQTSQPPLLLEREAVQADLGSMEYRQVEVTGEYDHAGQIALRNQYWGNQWGVHLVTPLRIADSQAVILVDRGWIPADDFERGDWSAYDEPGLVQVSGVIRAAQSKADFGSRSDPTPAPGAPAIKAWNFVNVEAIQAQTPYPLLGAYIQQAPDPAWTGLPYRSQPDIEISEGPHLGYAVQWFSFAAVLGLGYPFFIRRQEKRGAEPSHFHESPLTAPGAGTK
jgi:surfeit locus 1 family protein